MKPDLFTKSIFALTMGVALAVAAVPVAQAGEITYYYSSVPYTDITDPTFGTNLTGYITLETDPTSTCPTCTNLVDWSFTSGQYTINHADVEQYGYGITFSFPFAANYPSNYSDPNATEWEVGAEAVDPGVGLIEMSAWFDFGGNTFDSAFFPGLGGGNQVTLPLLSSPGTWTEGPTPSGAPEPSSGLSLVAGLVGIALFRVRKAGPLSSKG